MALSPSMRAAAAAYAAKLSFTGQIISQPTVYDVAKPTNPTIVQLTGGVNRAAIKFDTGNAYIGTKPVEFTFYWRKLTLATSGAIVVCIRKASDDTIAATLGEVPCEGQTYTVNELRVGVAIGANNYAIVANDLLSIEIPSGIEIVTLGPSGKEDPSGRLFEHTYKRYKKSGWLSEVLLVDDDGKVEVDQITTRAYSLDSLPHRELSTEELQPRRNYWKIHAAPMDKIEQARKRAEELKKTQEEYEEKKSKLTPEEREALQKYETDMLMSGFTSLMKRDD